MTHPALFTQVVEISKHAVSSVQEPMLALPTPCPAWNVRQLINHMTISCRFSASIIDETPPTEDRLADDDVLGSDYKASYRAAADAAIASFTATGAMQREVDAPIGRVPGEIWISFPTWDLYMHTWDLATATGITVDQPEAITNEILAWGEPIFASNRDIDQVGSIIPVPDDASAIDRLAAYFGRNPQ